jgi:hypothetical protein
MATAAGDRLADVLGGEAASAASSMRLKAGKDDLRLDVEGVGRVQFPVPSAQARQLIQLGRPAQFGRGEETLTDREVRDTWEIPKNLVTAQWNEAALSTILTAVREGLGLPSGCELTTDFHSMLVYAPNQFFIAHQDSEKDDAMIGTLVVTLPSAYTGGELLIEHGGEIAAYRGSKAALSLVAFYADCRHEVLRVKSGSRITLTYNLLLTGDITGTDPHADPAVGELARCLREHFTTPVPRSYSGPAADPPNRLVYLLDHEYTARGLSWSRLKGADASRASLLRAAAGRAGAEAVLALADVQETWSAFETGDDYGYQDWYDEDEGDDDDEYGGDDSGDDEYELQELIDSSVRLTHWTGPDGTRLEEVSLSIGNAGVCASTPTGDLKPYSSEYEGYMGNYGNTLDRWYRRAAVVVWPREQAFANRAETSPAWALDELAARVRAGDLAGARTAAATLAPFWNTAARAQEGAREDGAQEDRGEQEDQRAGLLSKALQTAGALADAAIATMLLRPFRLENLRAADATALVRLAEQHGDPWTDEVLPAWFDERRSWPYAGRRHGRSEWVAGALPGLCQALHAKGGPGAAVARRLLGLSWDWLGGEIRQGLAASAPSYRDKHLAKLGQPLTAVFAAAALTGAMTLRDTATGFVRRQGDEVIPLVISALRATDALPDGMRPDGGFDELAADCARRLRERLARPPRPDDDWSIELPGGCTCELCGTLGAFLKNPARRTFEWPLRKDRRQHVHTRIDAAELPVSHQTRRQGSPYTLVLTKTRALFESEHQIRARDEADLAWLTARWRPTSADRSHPGH